MTDWILILTPLAVLPMVLLFRFVGCGLDKVGEYQTPIPLPKRNPPKYRDYILADPSAPPAGVVAHYDVTPNGTDVIGYWRLIDPKPEPAVDEKGFQHGQYLEVGTQTQEPLSDSGSGPGLVEPSAPSLSLIASDPLARCRTFRGGCVKVPNRPEFYPDSFTVEAWVRPRWTNTGFEHTLVSAGNPLLPTSPQGFALCADATNKWIIRFAPYAVLGMEQLPPLVDLGGPSHIAVTVQPEGGGRRVKLFVNGNLAGSALALTYTAPSTWELYIGAASMAAAPNGQAIYRPFIGEIQEVVLHKKALSRQELENHVAINVPLA